MVKLTHQDLWLVCGWDDNYHQLKFTPVSFSQFTPVSFSRGVLPSTYLKIGELAAPDLSTTIAVAPASR
jgi:hypothetical protein